MIQLEHPWWGDNTCRITRTGLGLLTLSQLLLRTASAERYC